MRQIGVSDRLNAYTFNYYPLSLYGITKYNAFFTAKKECMASIAYLRNSIRCCYIRFHIAYHSDKFRVCIDKFSSGNAETTVFHRKCFFPECPVSFSKIPELIGYHVFM
jgi:hypothetical protein